MHPDLPDDDPARGLGGEVAPPRALRRRVVRTLRDRGLLVARLSRPAVAARVLGSVAAAVLLFAAGALLAGRREAAADARPRFALLLYEDAAFQPRLTQGELVAQYTAWADSLRGEGRLVLGAPLDAADAAVLGARADTVAVTPGHVETAAGTLAGFFIVRAATRDEALAIARRCPHLRHGGRVELRRLPSGEERG